MVKANSSRGSGESGFTLLELLISMSLLALLSVLMFSSLSLGTRVWGRAQSAGLDTNKVRIVQEELRRELSQLYPLVLGDAGNSRVDFNGQAKRISYIRSNPDISGAFERIGLDLSDAGTLVRESLPERPSPDKRIPGKRDLLTNIETLEFAYFGPGPDGDKAPQWWSSWKDRAALPSLIRIRMTFSGRNAVWPDLVVAPRIETDVNCTYDPLTKNCQGRI